MNELDELRLKVAKAQGWRYVKLAPTPDNDVILPKRDRTCYQIYAPGEINDNPFWTATEMEWPENWQKTYRASEVPDWPHDISDAWKLVKEVQGEPHEQWFDIQRTPCISKRWIAAIGGIAKAGDTAPEAISRAWLAWKEANP